MKWVLNLKNNLSDIESAADLEQIITGIEAGEYEDKELQKIGFYRGLYTSCISVYNPRLCMSSVVLILLVKVKLWIFEINNTNNMRTEINSTELNKSRIFC